MGDAFQLNTSPISSHELRCHRVGSLDVAGILCSGRIRCRTRRRHSNGSAAGWKNARFVAVNFPRKLRPESRDCRRSIGSENVVDPFGILASPGSERGIAELPETIRCHHGQSRPNEACVAALRLSPNVSDWLGSTK